MYGILIFQVHVFKLIMHRDEVTPEEEKYYQSIVDKANNQASQLMQKSQQSQLPQPQPQ
jgi:hypothetical protein